MASLLDSARKNKSTWRPNGFVKDSPENKSDWYNLSQEEFCQKYNLAPSSVEQRINAKLDEFDLILTRRGAEKLVQYEIETALKRK